MWHVPCVGKWDFVSKLSIRRRQRLGKGRNLPRRVKQCQLEYQWRCQRSHPWIVPFSFLVCTVRVSHSLIRMSILAGVACPGSVGRSCRYCRDTWNRNEMARLPQIHNLSWRSMCMYCLERPARFPCFPAWRSKYSALCDLFLRDNSQG